MDGAGIIARGSRRAKASLVEAPVRMKGAISREQTQHLVNLFDDLIDVAVLGVLRHSRQAPSRERNAADHLGKSNAGLSSPLARPCPALCLRAIFLPNRRGPMRR